MRALATAVSLEEQLEIEGLIRRQFVVRDQDELITCFDPEMGDTLESALRDLVGFFHAPDGEGYAETDMVIWQDRRIIAVVRMGRDGSPQSTIFE